MRVLASSALIAGLLALSPVAAAEIVVGDAADALATALQDARPGDFLRLGAARYAGPIVIDRPVTLIGQPGSEIVGPGSGSVVTITSGDVSIEGVGISGSGIRLDELDSGVMITKEAKGVRIAGNRITGNLTGIDVQGGANVTVTGNVIVGRTDIRLTERGPGIYVWNAPGLMVEGNDISEGRDGIFVNTSHGATYRDNRLHGLRFAFHSMYANDITVTGNLSTANDLGFAFMYSRNVVARDNLSDHDRTHGIFLNYVTGGKIEHNGVRSGGEKCLFVYNVNRVAVSDNRFEDCEIGVHFTGGSERVTMVGNAFLANRTPVKYVGSRWLEWSEGGRGNYWSGHVAFDVNGDGLADSPYRPNDSVDQLTWSQPASKLLLGSPAVQMIRWAQSRFPGLLPGGVVDSHPLMTPGAAGPRQKPAQMPLQTPLLSSEGPIHARS